MPQDARSAEEEPVASFLDLPCELQGLVLAACDTKQRKCTLPRVCRHFRWLTQHSGPIWASLELNPDVHENSRHLVPKALSFWKARGQETRELRVLDGQRLVGEGCRPTAMLAACFPGLQALTLHAPPLPLRSLQLLQRACPRLRLLRARLEGDLSAALRGLAGSLPALVCLQVGVGWDGAAPSAKDLTASLAQLQRLRWLGLDSPHPLELPWPEALTAALGRLAVLDLGPTWGVALPASFGGLARLARLSLTANSWQDVWPALAGLASLRSLHLSLAAFEGPSGLLAPPQDLGAAKFWAHLTALALMGPGSKPGPSVAEGGVQLACPLDMPCLRTLQLQGQLAACVEWTGLPCLQALRIVGPLPRKARVPWPPLGQLTCLELSGATHSLEDPPLLQRLRRLALFRTGARSLPLGLADGRLTELVLVANSKLAFDEGTVYSLASLPGLRRLVLCVCGVHRGEPGQNKETRGYISLLEGMLPGVLTMCTNKATHTPLAADRAWDPEPADPCQALRLLDEAEAEDGAPGEGKAW